MLWSLWSSYDTLGYSLSTGANWLFDMKECLYLLLQCITNFTFIFYTLEQDQFSRIDCSERDLWFSKKYYNTHFIYNQSVQHLSCHLRFVQSQGSTPHRCTESRLLQSNACWPLRWPIRLVWRFQCTATTDVILWALSVAPAKETVGASDNLGKWMFRF